MKRVSTYLLVFILLAACNLRPNRQVTPAAISSPDLAVTPAAISPTVPAVETPQVDNTLPPPFPSPTLPEPTPQVVQIIPLPVPPLPAGSKLEFSSLTMFENGLGWALGGGEEMPHRVFKTTDGGQSWVEVTPPEPRLSGKIAWAAAGAFPDPNRALVVYQPTQYWEAAEGIHAAPYVTWRTTDGGASWQPSQSLDLSGLDEIFSDLSLEWIDPEHAWLLAHVGVGMNHDYIALFRTLDGGGTWERLLDPYTDGGIQACRKTGMDFVNTMEGWLTGTCNGVAAGTWFYRTLDGGSTWLPVEIPEPQTGMFADIVFECITDDPIFFPGVDGTTDTGFLTLTCRNQENGNTTSYLYNTQNGGERWVIGDYPGGDIVFQDPLNGWALSQTIYSTHNGGVTFNKLSVVAWQARFTFVGRDLVWAAARSESGEFGLVRSVNGGQRWELLQPVVK